MAKSTTRSKAPAVSIDISVDAGGWPSDRELEMLARLAVEVTLRVCPDIKGTSELSVVFTDDSTVQKLNAQWRARDKPTNVLSFPAFSFDGKGTLPPMLGDIVLAGETVRREAALEGKPFEHHLSHLVVHGLLHLLGYDHEQETEAEAMEALERRALAALAIPDPYE